MTPRDTLSPFVVSPGGPAGADAPLYSKLPALIQELRALPRLIFKVPRFEAPPVDGTTVYLEARAVEAVLDRFDAAGDPRASEATALPQLPTLKHPTRTILVATRLSEQVLHTTYLNALDEDEPSVVTVVLSEPPHTPVAGGVPDVGQTTVTVNR